MREGGQHRCNGTRIDLDKISIFRHNLVLRETRLRGIRLANWHILGASRQILVVRSFHSEQNRIASSSKAYHTDLEISRQ